MGEMMVLGNGQNFVHGVEFTESFWRVESSPLRNLECFWRVFQKISGFIRRVECGENVWRV